MSHLYIYVHVRRFQFRILEPRRKQMENSSENSSDTQLYLYVLRSPSQVAREANVRALSDLCRASPNNTITVVTSNESPDLSKEDLAACIDIEGLDIRKEHPDTVRLIRRRLSNSLKHRTALQLVQENARRHPRAWHAVLEDDVLFNDQAIAMLRKTAVKAPADADLVFLGLPSSREATPGEVLYEPLEKVLRILPCCESYLVTPTAAARLLGDFLPVKASTPAHLQSLFQKHGLKVYICTPSVFLDGSKVGVFLSSIEHNNALLWHPQWSRIQSILLQAPPGRPLPAEGQREVEELIRAAPFKEHPDFRHLVARVRERQGRYAEAKQQYDKALEIYLAEDCTVAGPDNRFLKDFIQVFQHLQEIEA